MFEREHHSPFLDALSAILICMAVASMVFSTFYCYKYAGRFNFSVKILILLIISAVIRVIEKYSYTDNIFDPKGDYYGIVIGTEIAVAWSTLLIAEYFLAIKFFQASSQLPAVMTGQKSFNEIDTKSTRTAVTIGCLANVCVSIWPGILYATSFYKPDRQEMQSIFWEF